MKRNLLISSLLILIISQSFCQSIPVGSYSESLIRTKKLLSKNDSLTSFTVQPLNSAYISNNNKGIQNLIASGNLVKGINFFGSPVVIKVLPVSLLTLDNPTRPYGYNNGSLYPSAGMQAMFTAGIFIKLGILNVQLKPELVTASNKYFSTFAETWGFTKDTKLLSAYFNFVNGIDAPERFGENELNKAYSGQSKITLIYKGLEAGASTENMWWGPGVQNSIMMSNSAPGFLHWTFNTAKPIKTLIGSFEWQLIGGRLQQSKYLPLEKGTIMTQSGLYIPKPVVTRYISAVTLNWQPKWFKGLFIGVSAYDYTNKDSSYNQLGTLKKTFLVFSPSSNSSNGATGGDGKDNAYAINIRQVLPAYNAEFYAEWARNDHSANLVDFLQEPEQSSAYTLGAIKLFKIKNDNLIQVKIETTNLERAPTYLVRQEPSWYVHSDSPRDGYTNEGRYVGAGIGPGSSSIMTDVSFINKLNSFGINFERLRHNNDLFYQAFAGTNDYDYNWVDLATTLYAKLNIKKNYLITFQMTRVYTLSYEYYTVPDQSQDKSYSYHFALNLSYCFD